MLQEAKQGPMDENTQSALNYGHVGRPFYSTDVQSWSFLRSFTRAPAISYIGSTKTVILPLRTVHPSLHGPYGRPLNPKSIPQALPDLGVGWSSIHEQKISHEITAATNIYDPHVSTLLDLGYALDLGQGDLNHISVAAAVTGECGNILSLRVLVDDPEKPPFYGLEGKLPTIGDTETAEWSTQGAPIRQVCFSQPAKDNEDRSTWMAARLPESTTIFRPLYEQDPAPRYLHDYDPAELPSTLQPSRLDANPVVEILSTHTGGFPHIAVSFNPWHQRQVVILDMSGNWSLWKVQTRHKRRQGNGIATPGQSGSLPLTDLDNTRCIRHDGWGSIQWIGDSSTILVADRRCVMVFQMEGDEIRSRSVELTLGRESEWVLDVQRSRRNMAQFFVLTTTRLLWYDLTTASLDEEGLRLPLQHSLAWYHYRHSEDTTLRLSELLIGQSMITELIQVYPCSFVGDTTTETIIGPDPFLLHMPPVGTLPARNNSSRYSTFVFREVSQPPAAEMADHSSNMTFIKLYWIDSSYTVNETLFKGPSQHFLNKLGMELGNATENRRVPGKSGPRVSKSDLDDSDDPEEEDDDDDDVSNDGGDDLDDFIVEDMDESVMPSRAPPQNNLRISFPEDLEWTISWSRVYKLAVANIARGANPMSIEESQPTFDRLIEELKNETSGDVEYWRNCETMLEISGGRPVSNDMDQITEDLKHLSSIIFSKDGDSQHQSRFMTLPLQFSTIFPRMPVTTEAKQISQEFSETYDQLVKEWLTKLPHDVPLLTRRMKERIVRGVALDLLLSRLIQINNNPTKMKPSQPIESMTPTPATESHDIGQGLASSQFPSTQDMVTDNQDKNQEAMPSAYSSLSAFTTFKAPRSRSQNVVSLLSHWEPGADPSAYDWEQASLAQSDGGMPGLDKSRRRSRKKRSQPSQPSQHSQLTPEVGKPSLPPTPVASMLRTWGSQPDQSFPMASSQPTMDGAPMTQTERGLFGAREMPKSNKTKKKRRAGGF